MIKTTTSSDMTGLAPGQSNQITVTKIQWIEKPLTSQSVSCPALLWKLSLRLGQDRIIHVARKE